MYHFQKVCTQLILQAFLLIISPCRFIAQSEQGLVAKFTFNKGSGVNESGGDKPKLLGVTFVDDRFGNRRSAAFFQGNPNSYINLGTSETLKPKRGTISLWFSMASKQAVGGGIQVNPIILTKSSADDDFYEGYVIEVELVDNKITAATSLGQQMQVCLRSADPVKIMKWYHVVYAYDDEYIWLYINGVMQNEGAPFGKHFRSRFLPGDSVVLGTTANCKNERFFCGSIDDVRIYNRVLTPDEVLELYREPDPNRSHIFFVWLYWLLGAGLVIFVLQWFIRRRYRREMERERDKNEVKAQLNNLETRALRAQMNPHFIFNSLSTLDSLILEKNPRDAHEYLAKFSKLFRKLLETSDSDSILLSEEIEILNRYIELEVMRFSGTLQYSVECRNMLPDKIYIPLMMVQPLVENAVWHGLQPKKDNRRLRVEFSDPDNGHILCVIEDNGVGINANACQAQTLKKKSMAIRLIKQRLQVLSDVHGIECSINIIDLGKTDHTRTGTRVELQIPKLNQL